MTYLLIRQRCCLSGHGVGTTQLLQLWCHHAAALLVSVECHFLPAARPRKTLKRRSLAGRTILRPKPRVASASKVRTHATKASRIVCHSHSSPARQAQQPDKRLEIASALRQTKVVDWKCSTEQLSEQVQYRNAWILNLEESMAEHLTTTEKSSRTLKNGINYGFRAPLRARLFELIVHRAAPNPIDCSIAQGKFFPKC